ncbi:MAG: glycosyltransferase family 4 protein [Thermoflexales bacterium]|nr:glycosyltransferase family 4 protein [Thermoflexales bacterium]
MGEKLARPLKVRHVLPQHGKVPVDPAREAVSGFLSTVIGLARAQASAGKKVHVYGWRPDRLVSSFQWDDGTRVTTSSGIPGLRFGKYDFRYFSMIKLLTSLTDVADIMQVHTQPYQLKLSNCRKKVLHLNYMLPFDKLPGALIAQAAAVLCVNSFMRDRFVAGLDYPPERVHVVYNGVEPSRFQATFDVGEIRAAWHASPNDIVILYAGAIVPVKGLLYLVRALRVLFPAYSNVRLVIVGSTRIWQQNTAHEGRSASYDTVLEDEARGLPVCFAGEAPFAQMPAIYSACDIFVLPSVIDEGLPLSVIEAMAAGKPVVGSAVGGISEAVVQGETGFLVPPGEPEALAAALKRLVEDRTLATRFGCTGRERVHSLFAWSQIEKQVDQIYRDVLGL